MNCFYMTKDGSLDRVYLRTCAIHKLLKSKKISINQAKWLSLRPIKGSHKKHKHWLSNTIDNWVKRFDTLEESCGQKISILPLNDFKTDVIKDVNRPALMINSMGIMTLLD